MREQQPFAGDDGIGNTNDEQVSDVTTYSILYKDTETTCELDCGRAGTSSYQLPLSYLREIMLSLALFVRYASAIMGDA